MRLKQEILDLENEIKNLESMYREAALEYQQKDAIATAAVADSAEAHDRKEDLYWQVIRRKEALERLKREAARYDLHSLHSPMG